MEIKVGNHYISEIGSVMKIVSIEDNYGFYAREFKTDNFNEIQSKMSIVLLKQNLENKFWRPMSSLELELM
jgi:hypothetical protein